MEVHRSREGIVAKKLGLMLCGCSGPCRPTFPFRNRPNPASFSKQITITTSIFFSVLGRPKRASLAAARISRGPGIFHGAATGLFSGCPSRRFGHTFTADFALGGRAVNVNRIMAPSASATAKYQHQISFLASSIEAVFTYSPRLPLSPLLQPRRLIFTS